MGWRVILWNQHWDCATCVGPEVGSIKQRVQSCDEGSSIIRIAIEFTANGWLNVFVFQMNARDGGKWRTSGVHMEAAAVVGRKIIPNHDYVSQENEELRP